MGKSQRWRAVKKIFVSLLFAAMLFFAAFALYRLFLKTNANNTDEEAVLNDSQVSFYKSIKPDAADDSDEDGGEEAADYLAEARAVNPDIVAWLTIPDTKIDFPIVYSGDNSYYLSHNFEKKSSYMGCPFLDYRCETDFSGFNSIIYGHNISNKYMFYPLRYFTNADYFMNHDYGILTTADKIYRINFLGCAVIESDGFAYEAVFTGLTQKKVFLETLQEKAVNLRDFDAEEMTGERLVTLSTCSYEFDEARTVLIGYLEETD